MTTQAQVSKPEALLTMGLPGAGKSYVLQNYFYEFTASAVNIDPDEIKKEKMDYDPKRPDVHHEWSKREAKARMQRAMHEGVNLSIDGTGTNVEKMAHWIKELQCSGYTVTLCYVQVSLKTSLIRNASRERIVPEEIIREKAETISTAFELLSPLADNVRIINND